MSALLRHFPEYDLTVRVTSRGQTADDVIRFYKQLDRAQGRWLIYFDPIEPPDLQRNIPISRIPELKRVISEKRRALLGDRPQFTAVVSGSRVIDVFQIFWERYYSAGEDRDGSRVAFFIELDEAFDWLGLTDAARAAVMRTLEEFEQAKTKSAEAGVEVLTEVRTDG